jgi:hypothetical protein
MAGTKVNRPGRSLSLSLTPPLGDTTVIELMR